MKRPGTLSAWWVGLVLIAISGCALGQTWHPADTLRQTGWKWDSPEQFDLPGSQVSLQRFRTQLAPVQAARQLAQASGMRLTRLQWAGAVLFLSGGQGAEHWLAQVQPSTGGAIGLVSRLVPVAVPAAAFDPRALAPPGARRVFQLSGRSRTDDVSLSSFDCSGTLSQVAADVGRALRAARWSAAQPEFGVLPSEAADLRLPVEWRHPDLGRLFVHLHPRPRSVALTFRHDPKESS